MNLRDLFNRLLRHSASSAPGGSSAARMAHPEEVVAVSEFKHQLSETLEWCCPRFSMAHLATSLRSPELQPRRNLVHGIRELEDIRAVVKEVTQRRSLLLAEVDERKREQSRRYRGDQGRLLALYPLVSLSHGLSVSETGGFIDADEIPPWDSWISFVGDVLVSWVPSFLIPAVDSAIACNPEESILWLSSIDRPFVAQLRKEGLV